MTVMKVVKVRRVGKSNVVSIPREFETSGYTPGASVLIDVLADGELRILPTDRVRDRVRQIADRVVMSIQRRWRASPITTPSATTGLPEHR